MDDPKRAIPPYDAIVLLAPKRAGDAALKAALAPLLGKIDIASMREANLRAAGNDAIVLAGCGGALAMGEGGEEERRVLAALRRKGRAEAHAPLSYSVANPSALTDRLREALISPQLPRGET